MTARPHRPLLALGLRLGAALLLGVMFVFVKLAAENGAHLVEISANPPMRRPRARSGRPVYCVSAFCTRWL